jgi:hypothetical protein
MHKIATLDWRNGLRSTLAIIVGKFTRGMGKWGRSPFEVGRRFQNGVLFRLPTDFVLFRLKQMSNRRSSNKPLIFFKMVLMSRIGVCTNVFKFMETMLHSSGL